MTSSWPTVKLSNTKRWKTKLKGRARRISSLGARKLHGDDNFWRWKRLCRRSLASVMLFFEVIVHENRSDSLSSWMRYKGCTGFHDGEMPTVLRRPCNFWSLKFLRIVSRAKIRVHRYNQRLACFCWWQLISNCRRVLIKTKAITDGWYGLYQQGGVFLLRHQFVERLR